MGIGFAISALSAAAYCATANHLSHSADSGLRPPPYREAARASVSVCVPAYQEETYLPTLLTSIQNQTHPVSEVIVADSSEDEATAKIAREYGALVVPVPYGNIARARNVAASTASGDILLFSDADVLMPSEFIGALVDDLQRAEAIHPREVIYGNWAWTAFTLPGTFFFRGSRQTTRCVGVHASAYRAVGGYDERCNPREGCREDLAFGRRLIEHFGPSAVRVGARPIGTSDRRYIRHGSAKLGAGWSPVRRDEWI